MFQLFMGFFKNCFLEVRARSLTLALEQNNTVLFSVRTIQCCILLTVHAKHVPFKNRLVKTVLFCFFLVWKLMRTVGKRRSKRERIFFLVDFSREGVSVLTDKTCGRFLLAHGVHRQLSHVFLRLQVDMKVYNRLVSFIHLLALSFSLLRFCA